MIATLRQPKWLVLGVLAMLLAGLFVNLGLWQLRRLAEVRQANAIVSDRLLAPTAPLHATVDPQLSVEDAGSAYAFRQVTATGRFDRDHEFLVRSQTLDGIAGFHVITPLVVAEHLAILVNRGWVPLTMDTPPVPAAPPPGEVTVTLVLQASQTPSRFSVDETSEARRNRVDIERAAELVPYDLYPVYGLAVTSNGDLPVPVELPELGDGPHLSYSIQWFAFAVIALGGFVVLARKAPRRTEAGREADFHA